MKILVRDGKTRTIGLITRENVLLFRHIKTKDNTNRCAIKFESRADVDLKGFKKLYERDVDGFLGLIENNGDVFICTITGRRQVASPIPSETINKIHAVEFFCVNRADWDFMEFDANGMPIVSVAEGETEDDISSQQVKHPCADLRKLLSSGGFYYSSDFDLTSTLQDRGINSHSLSIDDYKEEYMWNNFMLKEMIDFRDKLSLEMKEKLDDDGFLTTVIRGFAETFSTSMQRTKVLMTVISRQSWKRAGTRFNSRGIDDEGYVSNFVETETILYCEAFCYSFIEIRGSVPIFWEQDTSLINPKVQITRSEEATQPIFDEHFKRLLENYHAVHIVNLLSFTKSNEVPLSKRYKYHLKNSKETKENVYLTEFDFHRETSDQGYESANKIYKLIKESLFEFGYYCFDFKQQKPISKQRGVFRTNCLDCLDRTNLIQQFISKFILTIFFKDRDQFISQESDLFSKHNTLWADNGDQISQIYTGTNALKSSFSRSGKMSFAGVLSDATKSVSRMYINNFVDKGKQQNIDELLGRLNGQQAVRLYDPINDMVTEEMNKLKSNFTTESSMNLFVGTYNVNGISRIGDLTKWLFPIGDKFKPDIVVLGFQEVIELTAGSILNADYSKSTMWNDKVGECLNQFDKYIMLRAEQMSSLIILFFARSEIIGNIKMVEGSSKKTGLGGITGNKGGVAIRFNYGATTFSVVNAHLAAGSNAVAERNNDYLSIMNGVKFPRGGKINDNDNVFWIGDLNYRISLENSVVRDKLREGDLKYLIEYDQLTREIRNNNVFKGYSEPSINFKPTYKFDKGTSNYDSSEKQRTPSWTDRIIYKSEGIKPLAYSSGELNLSDHKPVYAAYKCRVVFVDEEKKSQIYKKLYNQFKAKDGELIDVKENVSPAPVLAPVATAPIVNLGAPVVPPPRKVPPPGFSDSILQPLRSKTNSPATPTSASPAPPPPVPAKPVSLKSGSSTPNPADKPQSPPPVPIPRKHTESLDSWTPLVPK